MAIDSDLLQQALEHLALHVNKDLGLSPEDLQKAIERSKMLYNLTEEMAVNEHPMLRQVTGDPAVQIFMMRITQELLTQMESFSIMTENGVTDNFIGPGMVAGVCVAIAALMHPVEVESA